MAAKVKTAKKATDAKPITQAEQDKLEIAKEKPSEKTETQKEKVEVNVLKKAEPAKEKLAPLPPGQKYFEAPDGTHIIGEEEKQQLWYRKMNNGKGGWINPKR